jgi:hypothetical protein
VYTNKNHNRSRRTILDGLSIDVTEADAGVSVETRVCVEKSQSAQCNKLVLLLMSQCHVVLRVAHNIALFVWQRDAWVLLFLTAIQVLWDVTLRDAGCTSVAHRAICSLGTPHAVPTAVCGLHSHRAKSRDSSVSIVTRIWAGRSGSRFLEWASCIFPLRCPKPPHHLHGPLSSVPLAGKLHTAGGQSSASQRGGPALIPGQSMWDFWWTNWH